jgi:hypothetical protein
VKRILLPLALTALLAPLAYAHEPKGTQKNYCEYFSDWAFHDYQTDFSAFFLVLGIDGNQAGDCNGDGLPGDYDGHHEWAYGGAWLLVESGFGLPSVDPSVGAGTLYCFREWGHHPYFGPIYVDDTAFGSGTAFRVAADNVDLTGLGEGCGDGFMDTWTDCVGSCAVTFLPGLDGSYHVHVSGTAGHVVS